MPLIYRKAAPVQADTLVLLTTFGSTLLFEIDFAIYTGVLLSMAIYLTRTSHPHVAVMTPDPLDSRRRLTEVDRSESPECPQIKILRINGSLFFGAANHVSGILEKMDPDNPLQVLVVGYGINFIDVSGAMVLVQESVRRRKLKKNLYLCRINSDVRQFLDHGGFMEEIGGHLSDPDLKPIRLWRRPSCFLFLIDIAPRIVGNAATISLRPVRTVRTSLPFPG